MTNRQRNLVCSLIFLAFGAFMMACAMGVQNIISSDVGSGYVPKFIAGCIILVSAAKLILTLAKRSPSDNVKEKKDNDLPGGLGTIGLMFLYMLMFQPVGFILSSVVYLFAQILLLSSRENRRPLLFAAISVLIPVAVDALFVFVIKMPLPKGVLGF